MYNVSNGSLGSYDDDPPPPPPDDEVEPTIPPPSSVNGNGINALDPYPPSS